MRYLLLLAVAALSWAAPPTITVNPIVNSSGSNSATVMWRTSDASGATATLTANLTAASPNPSVSECSGFPVGSVIKVDLEHMEVVSRSSPSGACDLTVYGQNGERVAYDPEFLQGWTGLLPSISVTGGNLATVTTTQPHFYVAGDSIRVLRINGNPIDTDTTYSVLDAPTATTLRFNCPGCVNGTYTNVGMQVYKVRTAHTSGATVTRIDSDAVVCVGTVDGGPYNTVAKSPDDTSTTIRQSINHFVYVVSLLSATPYYAKAMSTPRSLGSSNCASPGSDTVVSSQFTFTTTAAGSSTPTAPNALAKTWDYHLTGLSYTSSVTAASNCSDLQTKINTARGVGSDGNLNYRVLVPANSNCNANLTCPAKTGSNPNGTGWLVVTTADYASLPTEGSLIDPVMYAGSMPTLYTSSSSPVIRISPSADYCAFWGLGVTWDSSLAFGGGSDYALVSSFTGEDADYDIAQDPSHIVLQQLYLHCPTYNDSCAGIRLHGDYLVVEGSYIAPVHGINLAGVQIDGYDSQYAYTHNNYIKAVFSGYFQSDNALNPKDTIVEHNTFEKPKSWQTTAWQYNLAVEQSVATGAAGATSTIVTAAQNLITTGKPLLFSGVTGAWASINYSKFSVLDGTLSLVCSGGNCAAETLTSHGMTTGDRIVVGGGYKYPCDAMNTVGYSVVITSTGATTFTFLNGSASFSTVSGTQCPGSEVTILGPVWYPTVTNNTTVTIPFNSTGLGAMTGSVTSWYPLSRYVKNAVEYKSGIRSLFTGNTVLLSPAELQSGQLSVASVRGSDMFGGWPNMGGMAWNGGVTLQDINFASNFFSDGCAATNILGANPNGPVTPAERFQWDNNLFVGISYANKGAGSCLVSPAVWSYGYSNAVLKNNTIVTDGGRLIDGSASGTGPVTLTGNIIPGYAPPSDGANKWGGMVVGQGGTAPPFLSWSVTRNNFWGSAVGAQSSDPWNYDRRYMSGYPDGIGIEADYLGNYWSSLVSQLVWTGQRSITCPNTTPITCASTTPHGLTTGDQVWNDGDTGSLHANGRWFVRVTDSTHYVLVGSTACSVPSDCSGTSAGTRSMTPFSGSAATVAAFTLGAGSPYLAGTSFVAPTGPPSYGSAGSGDDGVGGSVGIYPTVLAAALAGGSTPPPVPPSPTSRLTGGRVSGAGR